MIELKIRKFGNSLGVILPKDVINRLRTEGRGTAVPDRSARRRATS